MQHISFALSQLEAQQVRHHLARRDPRRPPQGPKVKRARKGICIAKSHHGRDPAPSVLERKTGAVHLVLLDGAAHKVVHAARRVPLRLVRSRCVRQLFAAQDMKVVVGRVSTSVSFSANCAAKYNEILGDAGVDNVHGAHGTARIVKDPFFIEIDVTSGQLLAQLVDNVLDNLGRIVAVGRNGTFGQVVQVNRVKDVKGFEMRLEKVKESGQQRNSSCKDGQRARHCEN